MKIEGKDFPFVRGTLLNNLSVMEYHRRTLNMLDTLNEQIKHIEEELDRTDSKRAKIKFKNPREENEYLHNLKTLEVMKRQRERLITKLNELQERIQEDIDVSKSVTPLRPLK